jgi:hypothetical protein
MSLIKLLSVSRSFGGGTNESGRYRMAEQALLPKFAPVGRPISLAPKGNPPPPSAVFRADRLEPKTAGPGINPCISAPALDSTMKKTPAFTERVADAAALSQPATKICQNAVPASTHWFRLPNNPFVRQPTGGIAPPRPVQAELSLDAVRPVRNDLSDADLEVVAAMPAATPADNQKPDRRRWFKPEVTGFAWSRLTARLFSSERVRV